MYSNEIQAWLSEKNFHLTPSEYIWLINRSGSIQIDHIKNENGKFHIWTNDGHEWSINVDNNL